MSGSADSSLSQVSEIPIMFAFLNCSVYLQQAASSSALLFMDWALMRIIVGKGRRNFLLLSLRATPPFLPLFLGFRSLRSGSFRKDKSRVISEGSGLFKVSRKVLE